MARKKSKQGGAREGAGRPPKVGPHAPPQIQFRLPRDVHDELEAAAVAAGVPAPGLAKAFVVAEMIGRRTRAGAKS